MVVVKAKWARTGGAARGLRWLTVRQGRVAPILMTITGSKSSVVWQAGGEAGGGEERRVSATGTRGLGTLSSLFPLWNRGNGWGLQARRHSHPFQSPETVLYPKK